MDILNFIFSKENWLIPSLLIIVFYYLSIIFSYKKSDDLKKIFGTPIEKFSYFLSVQIIKTSVAIVFSTISIIYFLFTEKISITNFIKEIESNNNLVEKFTSLFIIITILFLIFINLLLFLFKPLFPKKDYLEGKYFFYAQDCDKTKDIIKKNTPIYLVEPINQNDLLCFYNSDQKKSDFIRIIIPYTSIISININNKIEPNIFKYYLNLNIELRKLSTQEKFKKVIPIIIIEIFISIIFYFVSGGTLPISKELLKTTVIQTLILPNFVIFIPTIFIVLKNKLLSLPAIKRIQILLSLKNKNKH
ncbi:TPA: hypothetical protein ACF0SI_002701 [Enterococcus hirae]